MKKSVLIKRWENLEGLTLRERILKDIKYNKDITKINELKTIDEKLDLRGLTFPLPAKVDKIKSYTRKIKPFHFNKNKFINVDFSYCDFSYCFFNNCTFENCIFVESKLYDVSITACDFISSNFINCNLSNSFLNNNNGRNSGSYIDCYFIKSNFSKSGFNFPIIKNCIFDNCKMKEVNFDGSRFYNSKFIGLFTSGWFNGYSIYARTGLFSKIDPKKYPNKMIDVDFSEANLDDISFQHEIDLSKCKFPENKQYIIIKDIEKVFNKVSDIINNTWTGEFKRIALEWVHNIHYNNTKKGMRIDLINTHCITDYFPQELYDDFFELVRMTNKSIMGTPAGS